MSARRSSFRQADITRALKGAKAAGLNPSGCTIGPDGSIHVNCGDGGSGPINSFDRLRQAG